MPEPDIRYQPGVLYHTVSILYIQSSVLYCTVMHGLHTVTVWYGYNSTLSLSNPNLRLDWLRFAFCGIPVMAINRSPSQGRAMCFHQ